MTTTWDPIDTASDVELEYPDVAAWVERYWVRTIRRRSMPWCQQWWAHPEALARLGALWAAWETANAEGGASMSQWWLYHADGHLTALSDPRGPFAACTLDQHQPPAEPLPTLPPPEVQ